MALFEPSNPDWPPSLNLGYKKLSVISSLESACERNARRKRRNENKTVQDEKHKGNKKILHEISNQNEIINNSVSLLTEIIKEKKLKQNHRQILKRKTKS